MKTSVARAAAQAAYVGLIGWVMAWVVFLGDVANEHVSLFLILFATPLLIPLRGVLAARDKPMIWGALLALPYSVHGGMVVWGGGDDAWMGWIEVALGLGYVFSASYFIRWRAMGQQPA
jgi:uncharacterized membrane protein